MIKFQLKYLIFVITAVLIFDSGFSHGGNKEPEFIRETMFETGPGIAPLYLPLFLKDSYSIDFTFFYNRKNPIHSYSSMFSRSGGPSVGYFWALNCGDIIFINRTNDLIYILDVEKQSYQKLSPISIPYIHLKYLWVGPEDEIYVGLEQIHNLGERYKNYKLFRYKRVDNVYLLDDEFDMQANISGPRYIRIAPNGNLYVQGWGNRKNYYKRVGVFNRYGNHIKNTSAIGKTSNGVEFLIRKHFKSKHSLFDVINCADSTIILREEFNSKSGNDNFKCTFDNQLLIYIHNYKREESKDSELFIYDSPYIMCKDLNNEAVYTIDIETCSKRGYDYFNVADVSLNYKGEIYALIVYFNDPSQITGDEKIVLYRWRKQ